MLGFQKNGDIKSSLNIGMRSKRIFKNKEEIKAWMLDFPDVYTNGKIKKYWHLSSINFRPFITQIDFMYNKLLIEYERSPIYYFPLLSGDKGNSRVTLVRWIRENLRLENSKNSNESILLLELKWIVDEINYEINKYFGFEKSKYNWKTRFIYI